MSAEGVAWVPAVPPRHGMRVSISHPLEDGADGVVRYRVSVKFDPAETAFDDGVLDGSPLPPAKAVERVVRACNDILVVRRFSEFDTVFKAIAGVKGVSPALPPLPEKRIFGNKDPKFVEARRAGLEAFARAVLGHRQLFERPDFLSLIGCANVQLWYALGDDDGHYPDPSMLSRVIAEDGEMLRLDATQRASASSSDVVRRSVARLLHYAVKSEAGLKVFLFEQARVAASTVADRSEGEGAMMWAGRAIEAYANAGDVGCSLVARGDVRDGLLKVALRAWLPATLAAVSLAIAAIVHKGGPSAKQLYLTPAARDAIARLLLCGTDAAATAALLRTLNTLYEALPVFKFINQQLFVDEGLHGALGAARDRANAAKDSELQTLVSAAMLSVACPTDVEATPKPAPPTGPAVTSAAKPKAASPKMTAAKPAAAAPLSDALAPTPSGAIDDFLNGDDGFGDDDDEDGDDIDAFLGLGDDGDAAGGDGNGGGVDDFLADDGDAGSPAKKQGEASPPLAGKVSVDDFLSGDFDDDEDEE